MGNGNRYEGLDAFAIKLIKQKARQLVGRAGFVAADRHDLEQELMLDLIRRLPRFDRTRGKLEPFVAGVVKNRVATLIAAREAGIRDHRRDAGSLDEIEDREDCSADDALPVRDMEENYQALRLDVEALLGELPAEQRVLCYLLLDSTVAAISRELGVARETVCGAVEALRARFACAGIGSSGGAQDTFSRAPVCTQ